MHCTATVLPWTVSRGADRAACVREPSRPDRASDPFLMTGMSCWQDAWASFRPLPRACSLFARKFDFGALDAVIRQGQDCETGFGWSPLCA